MEDDYLSLSFNSYDKGPGKVLQKSQDFTLFVDHIPVSLTQVIITILCDVFYDNHLGWFEVSFYGLW